MTTPRATPGSIAFRVGAFPVTVAPSFWLVTALLGWIGHPLQLVPVWVAAAFVSLLVHELGHAIATRSLGGNARIALHAMGGATTPSFPAVLGVRQRLAFYLAGPSAGIAFGGVVYALSRCVPPPTSEVAYTALEDLLWMNWGYGLVNLLPIAPLDGGQAMRALVERVRGAPSPRINGGVSIAAACALAAYGVASGEFWAWFLLVWLGASHAPALKNWWQARRDAACEPDFEQMWALINARDFAGARPIADRLLERVRTPAAKARALAGLADIHLANRQPDAAAQALASYPQGWRPNDAQQLRVWMALGRTPHAIEHFRSRLATSTEPGAAPLLMIALVNADELEEAARVALAHFEAFRPHEVRFLSQRLLRAGRLEDGASLNTRAFERFGDATYAYDAARASARLGRLDEAVHWLERSVKAGFRDVARLEADRDLAALREHAGYAAARALLD